MTSVDRSQRGRRIGHQRLVAPIFRTVAGERFGRLLESTAERLGFGLNALMVNILWGEEYDDLLCESCLSNHRQARRTLLSPSQPTFYDIMDHIFQLRCVTCRLVKENVLVSQARFKEACKKLCKVIMCVI